MDKALAYGARDSGFDPQHGRFLLSEGLVNLAEWLRRQTRNLLGFPRAGSNPAVDESF
uniref:Uncharacterized protein n=1 Tax=Physcomitrium patens TaxID=3218 RepID=A0A2K1ISB6_PHYPA|nr:hypothetical protein PHYPA_026296 [Physcomitrium patens]